MAENIENTDINFYEVHSDKGLESIKTNPDYNSSFIHLHKKNEEENLYIGDCRLTDNFNTGNVPDSANTIEVGGLDPTTIEELKNKSLSEIVMQIICPKTYPEPTDPKCPSMTISYPGDKLIKVGTSLPTEEDIECSYTKGEWSDKNKTPYGGEPNLESKVISMSPDKWGKTSEEGQYVISGSIQFGEGGIPKDSYGNDWKEKQYTGGKVSSNSITITSVYPIYVTTYFDSNGEGDITRLVEQPLKDYISNENVSFYIEVPAEEDGNLNKFKIGIPHSININNVKVNQYNEVNGKYDIHINMEDMKSTDIYHYYIRTKDGYNTNGSAKYEIKLTR